MFMRHILSGQFKGNMLKLLPFCHFTGSKGLPGLPGFHGKQGLPGAPGERGDIGMPGNSP